MSERNTEDRDRLSLPYETYSIYRDPKVITIEELETTLKKAGTYAETVTEEKGN